MRLHVKVKPSTRTRMQTLKRKQEHEAVTNTETQARMPTQKTVQTESEKVTRQDNTVSFVVFFFYLFLLCLVLLLLRACLSHMSFVFCCCSFSCCFAIFFSSRLLEPLLLLVRPWFKCFSTHVLFFCCLYLSCLVFFSVVAFLFFAGPLLRLSFLLLCGRRSLSASVSVALGEYYSASFFVLTKCPSQTAS